MSTVSMASEGSFHGRGWGSRGWCALFWPLFSHTFGGFFMADGPHFGTILALVLGIELLIIGTQLRTFNAF